MGSSKMAKAQQEKPAGSLDYKKMQRIRGVSYPGRVVCLGKKEDGTLVQVYIIMGRSANSRNRIFNVRPGTGQVFTEAADSSKVEDPSLIIYNALMELPRQYIVTNGDQTDTIQAALSTGKTSKKAYALALMSQTGQITHHVLVACLISGITHARQSFLS